MKKTRYEGFLLIAINGYIVLVNQPLPPPTTFWTGFLLILGEGVTRLTRENLG